MFYQPSRWHHGQPYHSDHRGCYWSKSLNILPSCWKTSDVDWEISPYLTLAYTKMWSVRHLRHHPLLFKAGKLKCSEVSFHLAERWKSGGSNIWSRRLRSEVRDILFPSCLLDAESPWIMEWVTWLSYLVCWEVNSWVGRIIHHLSGRGCLSKDMGLGTNSSHLAGAERLKCGLWSGRQPAAYLLEAERLRCGVEDNLLPCL